MGNNIAEFGVLSLPKHDAWAQQDRMYVYICSCCKMKFEVKGFNPSKCPHCVSIVCEQCLFTFDIPREYLRQPISSRSCELCRLKAELEFIERIKHEELPVHIDWDWRTNRGRDAFLRRLDII